jgi:hypothetical protein
MAALCRILTAATLVVHLIVGCCSHHAHACDGGDCSLQFHSDALHEGHVPESCDDHSHHGANDCRGAKCTFDCSSRPIGSLFVLPCHAFLAVVPDGAAKPIVSGDERCFFSSGRLLLPVRLHLANQVLLI